jgi:opacity protein-like surface antigen
MTKNSFGLGGIYRYRPDISFTGGYTNNFIDYLDQGQKDLFQTIRFRGIYNWRQEHNLHAGVSVDIYNNRNGNVQNSNNVVVNVDFGDDFFSNYQINLSPTLTLTASTGISLNIGNNGQPVSNNTNINITKIWQTAILSAGVQHGLTSSYGVGGISNTTTVVGRFGYQVTEKLSTTAEVDFSFYDTDDGNFQTFQAGAGVQYRFTPWLASNLIYAYRWTNSSTEAANSGLLQTGVVRANQVYVALTANFDLWPNIGLARTPPVFRPSMRTPFPLVIQPTTTP